MKSLVEQTGAALTRSGTNTQNNNTNNNTNNNNNTKTIPQIIIMAEVIKSTIIGELIETL